MDDERRQEGGEERVLGKKSLTTRAERESKHRVNSR